RPGGFSDSDIRALQRVQNQLAVAVKVKIKDEIATNVMSAYLGPVAGQKVLNGLIQRGDGESIPAIIWYSDLRQSTQLAEKLGSEKFMQMLNHYFECTAGAILENGGEVLRFVGDAVLATFPLGNKRITRSSGRKLVAAVRSALAGMKALQEQGLPVNFGIGLHCGEVLSGNIGVPTRLEFTVIGATVNEVARIEDLTKKLKSPVLISQELAANLECELVSLGTHNVKGVGRGIEVFTLPELS
ncbi:MAG: adenylate cyclase, partial [Parasphingorhabdus sp.]